MQLRVPSAGGLKTGRVASAGRAAVPLWDHVELFSHDLASLPQAGTGGGPSKYLQMYCSQWLSHVALQVRTSETTSLLTCLLEGPSGAGKTALAATLGLESGFPFVKVITSDNMVGYSEAAKCQQIAKVFDDAYRVSMSSLYGSTLLLKCGWEYGPSCGVSWRVCGDLCLIRQLQPQSFWAATEHWGIINVASKGGRC